MEYNSKRLAFVEGTGTEIEPIKFVEKCGLFPIRSYMEYLGVVDDSYN